MVGVSLLSLLPDIRHEKHANILVIDWLNIGVVRVFLRHSLEISNFIN